MRGYVHSYESAGTVDGPGIRFVVFTAGCPLRCKYCHNPDTQEAQNGRLIEVDEVVRQIGKYRDFLRMSGGGVTISGGEPLVQPRFVTEILQRCHEMGLHTAVDTSGHGGDRVTDSLFRAADLFLLDLKSAIPDTYRGLTGNDPAPWLDFARRLESLRKRVWLRFVLVPGLTDQPENVSGVAGIAASLGNVERIEVLPFHQMGQVKYQSLGRPYALAGTPAPSREHTEAVREAFRARGLNVH